MTRLGNTLSVAVLALTVGLQAPAAQAQGLFDVLFGGGVKRQKSFPPAPRAPGDQLIGRVGDPVAPAAVRRVSKPAQKASRRAPAGGTDLIQSPTYNDYRPDQLVRVDFSPLIDVPQPVAFQPSAQPGFHDMAGALAGVKLLAEKQIAQAVVDHYKAHPEFIWLTNGAPNDKAEAAMKAMGAAADEALEPSDYKVDEPVAGADNADLMRFEMELSARALRYVRDATAGRIDPNRISGYYDFPPKALDLVATLDRIETTPDVATLLEDSNPKSAQYKALRDELATLKAQDEETVSVDPTLHLKPGQSSPELPKLIALIAHGLDDERGGDFGEILYRLKDSETYDAELIPAIKAEQKLVGLKPDGVIGPRTVEKLAGVSNADRIAKVQVAMEQLRWLPDELGPTRVFINEPAFMVSYFEDSAEKLSMRVVVGKVTNQTSFFYDQIEQVDFNPYWGVPQSIIVNEMLPRLRRDPGYLDRAGYEVFNAKGKKVPSSSVSWGAYGSKIPFNVRQTPSEANALGELKILFPNKHAIYMHDTPQKAFFARDNRALSHGCVRLSDPRAMAAAVLGKSVDYVAAKLKQGHSSEMVTRTIPVYIAYFTAWPNADGVVEYFGDVYQRDERLREAIGKTDAVRASTS